MGLESQVHLPTTYYILYFFLVHTNGEGWRHLQPLLEYKMCSTILLKHMLLHLYEDVCPIFYTDHSKITHRSQLTIFFYNFFPTTHIPHNSFSKQQIQVNFSSRGKWLAKMWKCTKPPLYSHEIGSNEWRRLVSCVAVTKETASLQLSHYFDLCLYETR